MRVDDESGATGWAYLRFRELAYTDAELEAIGLRLRDLEGRDMERIRPYGTATSRTLPRAALAVSGA